MPALDLVDSLLNGQMLRVGLPSQADAMAARKRLQPPRTRPKGGRSFLPVALMNRPSHGDTKKSRRHTLPFGSAQRVCCKYLFLGEWKTAPAARMERKTRPVCLGCCASNSHFARCPLRHQALVYAKPPRHSLQGRGALACFLSLLQSAEFVDNLQLKPPKSGLHAGRLHEGHCALECRPCGALLPAFGSRSARLLVLSRAQVPTVGLAATILLSCHLSQVRWQLIRTTKHAWRKAEQRQSQTTVKLPVVSMLLRFAAYFMVWV